MADKVTLVATHYGDHPDVRMASQEEIAYMDDITAIQRIESLREAARKAVAAGLMRYSRALYENACDIAEHNLRCVDVINEYADVLDCQGFLAPAAYYRSWYAELSSAIEKFKESLAIADLYDFLLAEEEEEDRFEEECDDQSCTYTSEHLV